MKNQIISHYPFSGMIPYKVSEEDPTLEVINAVATEFGVDVARIYGPSKEQEDKEARAVAMYFLQQRGMKLKAIGDALGGRSPSDVCRRINRFFSVTMKDPWVKRKVEALEMNF